MIVDLERRLAYLRKRLPTETGSQRAATLRLVAHNKREIKSRAEATCEVCHRGIERGAVSWKTRETDGVFVATHDRCAFHTCHGYVTPRV